MVVYAGVNGTKAMTEVYLKETVGATQVKDEPKLSKIASDSIQQIT